jgi:dienelactone hydrolase
MKKLSLMFLFVLLTGPLSAAIRTETVQYKEGKTICEGYLAYDDSTEAKRPGVIVVHEWMGLNDYAKRRARELAELGYVAFAADIYGKGVRATNMEEASKLSGIYKENRTLLRARVNAALTALKKIPQVDATKLAAIGYCFGGTAALELARSGADVDGVVSFHGGLSSPAPADAKNIKAKVLVLHGADDPFVKPEEISGFVSEMKSANVDWQMNHYSHAVHGFTNPDNGNDPSKGMAYNAKADARSWNEMKLFFSEIFK